MKRQIMVLCSALLIVACSKNNREESAVSDDKLDVASEGRNVSDVTTMAAVDAASPSPPAAKTPKQGLPVPPSQTEKRTNIDESIRRIWRDTPYEIVDIVYGNEILRVVGDAGVSYEAGISVTLRFPSGWLAECIGPNSPWGCQHLDSI